MVLSLPIPRWRLIVERLAAYALLVLGMVVVTFVFVWVSLQLTPVLEIDTGRIFNSTINIAPGALLVLAFSTLAGALMRTRSLAVAVSTVFVIGGFFVNFIGSAASDSLAAAFQRISFYHYYDSTAVMQYGLQLSNVLILLAAAAICAFAAVWCFERRDIG